MAPEDGSSRRETGGTGDTDTDGDPLEATTEPDVDAREAFSLLGHEIRLEILLALLEDWVAIYTEPKSYAELMDAVGVRDSGKFNYHLEQLRGVYVRKVADGYVPTASATALYRAVLAHRPTEPFDLEPTPIDADCPVCAATAVLRYERGFVSVDCADCEEWVGFTYSLPQRAFDGRDTDAVLAALDQRVRHDLGLVRWGQCPDCGGTTTVDLRLEAVDGDGGDDDDDDSDGGTGTGTADTDTDTGNADTDAADAHWVELECDTCSLVLGMDLVSAMITDDRVASAFREVGLDPDRYLWELPAGAARIESRDPPRLAADVDLEGADGHVTVVVDEGLGLESVSVRQS